MTTSPEITLSQLFLDEFCSDFALAQPDTLGALYEALTHDEWVDSLNASPTELARAVAGVLAHLLGA